MLLEPFEPFVYDFVLFPSREFLERVYYALCEFPVSVWNVLLVEPVYVALRVVFVSLLLGVTFILDLFEQFI